MIEVTTNHKGEKFLRVPGTPISASVRFVDWLIEHNAQNNPDVKDIHLKQMIAFRKSVQIAGS